MSFQDDLQAAAKSALCGWLANGGNALAATWIVNGAKTPATALAGAGAGLGLLALNYGCNYDSGVGGPSPIDGCKEASPGGWGYVKRRDSGGNTSLELGFTQVSSFAVSAPYQSGNFTVVDITADVVNQGTKSYPGLIWGPGTTFFLDIQSGTCRSSGSPDDPVQLPPYQHTSPTTNCTYNVEFQAWSLNEDGTAQPVLKISKGVSLFASGGVIGGCNFDPVIYLPPPGGGGGGPGGPIAPWQPGDDGPNGEPWWWPIVQAMLGRLAGAAIEEALRELFGDDPALEAAKATAKLLTGREDGKLPAALYDLTEACTGSEASPQTHEVPIPEAPALAGLAARSDALEILAQDQKSWPQPTCPRLKQQGEWVTVNFVSDEKSPGGEKRLRKRLRYRDLSATAHLSHVHHWEDFEWQAGPVCVISKGLEWGVPQVWAATATEGKRVIAHAAAVAGVDLADPRHEWVVTSSPDARFGQPGVMRVQRRNDGWIRVSKRDGPDGLPKLYGPPVSP